MPYLRLRIRHHFLRAVLAQPQSVSVHVLVCRKDLVLLLQPGIGAGAPLGARRVHPVSRAPPGRQGPVAAHLSAGEPDLICPCGKCGS